MWVYGRIFKKGEGIKDVTEKSVVRYACIIAALQKVEHSEIVDY